MGTNVRRWLIGGGLCVALVGVLAAIYARWIEPRRVQAVRWRIGVADLPEALNGVRIAHLTDFHVGMDGTNLTTLRRAVALAAAWQPDLVALTGDFVDQGKWEDGANLFEPLTEIAPTFAVLGNHDRKMSESEVERIVQALRDQGVEVLRNEYREVSVGTAGGQLIVVAVDDPVTGADDVPAAIAGLPPADPSRPAILLVHAPDAIEQLPAGRFAVTLAGHTHGGQMRTSPFSWWTPLEVAMSAGGLDSRYPRGGHVVNGNPLIVNNGLGVSGVPFRFLAPPQIGLLRLRPGIDDERDTDDPARYLTVDEETDVAGPLTTN